MKAEKWKTGKKIEAILIFLTVMLLGSVLGGLLNSNQKKEEQLRAGYTAESAIAQIKSQLNRYLTQSELIKRIVETGREVTDEYTIAGPFELVQGGTGVLLFDPIYTSSTEGEEQFWGFSVLVLNWEKFLNEVELNKLESAGYQYRIWKKEDETVDGTVVLAESTESVPEDCLEVACEVPNDTWYVDITPKQGWVSTEQTIAIVSLTVLLGMVTMAGYWQLQIHRRREKLHAEELERSAAKARAANEAKTRFLFNMSHDIRTPMNAIIGFSNLLEEHLDDREKVTDYIEKIKSSSSFLLSLINHVLEMARIESGEVTLSEQVGNIQELVTSIETVFEPTIQKKKLICSYEANVEHEYVICDETKVREIFLNIIGNAVKYTEQGGNIRVSVTEFPDHEQKIATYRIVVKDNGSGMSEEYLPHIFETFSREHSSTEVRVEGTGLGLPIVKSFLDLMGGTIQVESRPGEGTQMTIEVSFPIADEKQIREHQGQKKHRVMQNWKNKRILLAEDNDLNAEIVTTLLQENEFIVERVADGEPCVNMVKRMPSDYYRVILMDIQMPHMDGYQATQAIRKLDGARSQIPIIALTANAFEEDRQKAFACGMNEHVVKPIDMEQLLDALDTFTV